MHQPATSRIAKNLQKKSHHFRLVSGESPIFAKGGLFPAGENDISDRGINTTGEHSNSARSPSFFCNCLWGILSSFLDFFNHMNVVFIFFSFFFPFLRQKSVFWTIRSTQSIHSTICRVYGPGPLKISSGWVSVPLTRQFIEKVGLVHTLGMNGTHTHSLDGVLSEWSTHPLAYQFINGTSTTQTDAYDFK